MLRHHFVAVFRDPFRCSQEALDAVFPYCVGFLVGVFTAVLTAGAVMYLLT